MQRLPYYIANVTHFCKGGAKAPKPPLPPSPTTAADNLSKNRILDRQRMARGFSSTILGGYEAEKPATVLKTLLGQ
jgi:hypothetical protein